MGRAFLTHEECLGPGSPGQTTQRGNEELLFLSGVFFSDKRGQCFVDKRYIYVLYEDGFKKEGRNIISEICIVYYFSDLCKKRNHHGILGR